MHRIKYLKVKIKSLAAEQRIIKHEKEVARRRRQFDLVDGLQDHRIRWVRPEIRAALMAYGLLRGKTPEQIEPNSRPGNSLNVKRVHELVKKYGPPLQEVKAA